jgi:hypothetical protein
MPVWLHRVLIAHDIDNHVLNAASLLVNRREHCHVNWNCESVAKYCFY